MAKFDITEIQESTITTDLAGKIIGIYGTNNCGKSYVAARLFPGKTLWLATEKGYNAQGGLRPYDIENWSDFRDAVSQLTTRNAAKREKVRSMYKCVVVDVADKLPSLCTQYIINQYNTTMANKDTTGEFTPITDLTGIPWGAGHKQRDKEMDTQITKLALSGYCVCLIFHEETRTLKDNSGVEYEFTMPKNTFAKDGNALKDIPDFMIRVVSNGVDENGNEILSTGYCVQHKEFFARSRYTECPSVINPFSVENLKETIKVACEREAAKTGAKTVTYAEEEAARNEVKAQKKVTAAEMVEKIKPVFTALGKAKHGAYAKGIVEEQLGVGVKLSEVDDDSVDNLKIVYDKLVDYANEKDIAFE